MSTRLPETDLANWAFFDPSKKFELAERHVRPKVIPGTYGPSKKIIPDVLNCHFPLFPEGLDRSSWNSIQNRLRQLSRGNAQLYEMNIAILKSTYEYAALHDLKSTKLEALPLIFGEAAYQFAVPSIVRYRDRIAIVFMDLRRTGGLSASGREYIFSALYHQTISQYADLSDAELEIWRYQNNDDRTLVAIKQPVDIIPYDDLFADAQESHSILAVAKSGVRPDSRSGSAGGRLF